MDYNNHNTTLRTNKHLNFEERFYLEKKIFLGDSIPAISCALGRSRTTIYTELKRGTVIQIRQGKSQLVYLATASYIVVFIFSNLSIYSIHEKPSLISFSINIIRTYFYRIVIFYYLA